MGQTYWTYRAKVQESIETCCGSQSISNSRLENEIDTESKSNFNFSYSSSYRWEYNIKKTNAMLCISQEINENDPRYLYITNLDSLHNRLKCTLYGIDEEKNKIDSDPLPVTFGNFPVCYAGICYQENIKLPNNINTILNKQKKNHAQKGKNNYNVIFRNGGILYPTFGNTSNFRYSTSQAIIVDVEGDFNNDSKSNERKGYVWNLPDLPYPKYGHDLIFSKEYGLITIGGKNVWENDPKRTTTDILQLSLDRDDYDKWKWYTLTSLPSDGRGDAMGVILKSKDMEKGIMVFGGYNKTEYLKTVYFYDFETSGWNDLKSMKIGRSDAGKYYDENNDKIYIGGGINSLLDNKLLKECEYYNVYKNEWYSLPNTNFHHLKPAMWIMENNKNVLYVASCNNGMEYLDLRTKKWDHQKPRHGMLTWFDIIPKGKIPNYKLLK